MSIKLSFVGDISLNDGYKDLVQNNKKPFSEIINEFNNSDLVIGNLEAFCESSKGENLTKSPRLKASPESLTLLKDLNINIVSLANNHVYDNLYDGFADTIKILDLSNISHLGAYPINHIYQNNLIKNIKNKKICFLNYVHETTYPKLPLEAKINLNIYEKNGILDDIDNVRRKVDYVVLLLHWGIDNSHYPSPGQRKDAKSFINAGADLIVGHHTHTIQGYEKLDKKYVFYSLGNFCFAPFCANGEIYNIDYIRHSNSYILHITIDENNDSIANIIPIQNDNLIIKYGSKRTLKKT